MTRERPPANQDWSTPRDPWLPVGPLVHLPLARQISGWLAQRDGKRSLTKLFEVHNDARRSDELRLRQALVEQRALCRRSAMRAEPRAERDAQVAALAWIAAVAERVLGRPPGRGDMAAALAMLRGQAVEIASGPPRMLALAMAAVVLAWSGRPCHVLTADDGQAQLSELAMRPLFDRCDLRVAAITGDTSAQQTLLAYRVDVLYAPVRRLITDHCRELRLQDGVTDRLRRELKQWIQPAAGLRSLTRGMHSALIDEIDRVLIDDALNPVTLSAADDSLVLAEAIAAARDVCDELRADLHCSVQSDGSLEFTDAGRALAAELAKKLPVMWRSPVRRDELLLQALCVRDRLQPGLHYAVQGETVLPRPEAVAKALVQRSLMVGITQAIEARVGVPLSPIARTIERTSIGAFVARYHRLGGAGACLSGVAAELWSSHGLLVSRLANPPPRQWPLRREWLARSSDLPAWISRAANADTDSALLVIARNTDEARTLTDLLERSGLEVESPEPTPVDSVAPWRGSLWVLAPHGNLPPLNVAAVGTPLRLLLAEVLDSARAEQALLARLADSGADRIDAVCCISPQSAVLRDILPRSSTVALRLAAWLPGSQSITLPLLLACARSITAWRHRRQRVQLRLREQSLQNQLSFIGAGFHRPSAGSDSQAPIR